MGKFKIDFTSFKEQQQKKVAGSSAVDERFWKPSLGGKLEKSYLIRFLPSKENLPFVEYKEHSFDYTSTTNEKKRYWKGCINTFGYDKGCPICKQSWEYKDSAFAKDKKIGAERCRKILYVANVLVIKDEDNPENEGKVKLFRFGKSIVDKINSKMAPTEADKKDPEFVEFVPCDLYEGADFYLKIKEKGKFPNGNQIPNFEESKFLSQKPLFGGDDDKIEPILEQVFSLEEFVDPSKFPSNEEVYKLLGHELGTSTQTEINSDDEDDDDIPDFTPVPSIQPDTDDDDDDSFFEKMKKK